MRQTEGVADLYVKRTPELLMRYLRATSAMRGEHMRVLVIRAVVRELQRLGVDLPDELLDLARDDPRDDDGTTTSE